MIIALRQRIVNCVSPLLTKIKTKRASVKMTTEAVYVRPFL
jgi:hypothetical protein